MRVVIAEDSLLVREGVTAVLRQAGDTDVVAGCGDLPGLLAAVVAHRPDVVVTDVRMPPTSTDEGIQAATRLRDTDPGIGVVVLSQYAEPGYATALLDSGSAGRAYLLKLRVSDLGQLAAAVREVARGGSVIDPAVVEVLVSASGRARSSPLAQLTPRERDVLAEIAQGKSNAGGGPGPSTCPSGPWRSTSTRCSRSSAWRPSPTRTAGSRRCCCTWPKPADLGGRGASTLAHPCATAAHRV